MEENEKMTSLEIIAKEFTKDITLPDLKPNILMKDIFGRGRLGEVVSFGGSTFGDNSEKVDNAIENTFEMQRVWNRSHSQWTWKHINLGAHSEWMNFRQLCAEVAGRRDALQEAKWRHLENEVNIRRKEEELEIKTDEYKNGANYMSELEHSKLKWDIADLEIEIARLREGIITGMTYIEGGMKDILALNEIYETKYKPLFENFTEKDFEDHNSEMHMMRSIVQCIRDIRQFGVITKGEQEYLEQIGFNPSRVQLDLIKYVEEHEKNEEKSNHSVVGLHEFVKSYVTHFREISGIKAEYVGFKEEPTAQYLFLEPGAVKKD